MMRRFSDLCSAAARSFNGLKHGSHSIRFQEISQLGVINKTTRFELPIFRDGMLSTFTKFLQKRILRFFLFNEQAPYAMPLWPHLKSAFARMGDIFKGFYMESRAISEQGNYVRF